MSNEKKRKKHGLTEILAWILNLVLSMVLIASAVWVYSYKKSKDGEIARLNEIITLTKENNIIIPTDDFKEYASRYGLMTQFAQRYFPEELVYPGAGGIKFLPLNPEIERTKMDWEKITYENGRAIYQDGNYKALTGIDVSTYQGNIDWQKVKADGIDFALIRAGYRGYTSGKITADEQFIKNLAGANKAGVPAGVYFFSGAINEKEAIEEAEYVLNRITGYKVELAIAFDMEEVGGGDNRMKNLSAAEKTAIAIAFCERIKAAGYQPVIYGNARWLLEHLDFPEIAEYGIWFANFNYIYWPYKLYAYQYTSSGTVDGIKGKVDMNLGFFNYPD